ncbi:MAG: response regulator [Clostridiales bacterium]|nr:response regulator [Clostridiales bacterium]
MTQIRVVIIEDNPATIRSLVQTIDWEGLGCRVVGTASDGVSGKTLILDEEPDILLTDIRMPQMDGLQMLEEVRDAVPDMKAIIITGYDQFQYASRAIKLAVFDYILKPIRNDEVEKVIRRAIDRMRRQKETDVALAQANQLRRKAQLLSLLTNDSHAGQDVYKMLTDADLCSPAYYLMIIQPEDAGTLPLVTLNGMDDLLVSCQAHTMSVVLYDSVVIYGMREDTGEAWREEAERICQRIDDVLPVRVRIGISQLATSHHQIRQTYQQARQALWESAMGHISGARVFFHPEKKETDGLMQEMRRKMDALIEKAELTDESAEETARVLVEISGQQYSQLRALVSLYALTLSRKFPCSMNSAMDRALSAPWFVTSLEEVSSCLKTLCATLREGREAQESKCSLLTRNVLEYIRLHAAEKLKLNDVAEKYHVSVNYLSALIRKETGTTFHEHVLKAKMDIAHTMLADPRILVEEVARAVGYSNYISFYNTFKRLEHMTPTEYRNRLAQM